MKKRRDDEGLTGCKGILAATLLRALADVRDKNGHAREAAMWIDSDRRDYFLSFVHVCEALDLDPSAVRRTIRRTGERRGSCR
jgi:hypothetical protein